MPPPLDITWIPEHKSAASHSMRRYWRALLEAWQPGDRYNPTSTMDFVAEHRKPGITGRAYRAWQRNVAYPQEIRKRTKGSLVHVLDHSWTDMLSNVPRDIPKIVTVHDLIPIRSPEGLSKGQIRRFRQRLSMLPVVDAIIADSAYTKSDVIEFCNIDSSKIHVIPIGVDPVHEVSEIAATRRPDTAFRIGSIGSILPRKNLGIFPQALSELKSRTSRELVLERVGERLPDGLARAIREVIGEMSLIECDEISDSAVKEFYKRQDVIAFPSFYEGFGLPVLEGMAAGVPVVSSSTSSLPEVGGAHALYFDPENPAGMSEQLAKVANDQLPADWISSARKHAETFTWRRTLEEVYAVYDLVL